MFAGLVTKKQERFAGLVERAAPGTHRAIVDYIAGLALPKASTCRDIAAGNGALLARLREQGFGSLVAVEWDVKAFGLKGVDPIPVDLNEPFAERVPGLSDLTTAVEIIEHLENPRAFLAQVRRGLRPGGHLILTTPNINHWPARLRYLLFGEIRHFLPVDIRAQRHITAVTEYQMAAILDECGFTLTKTFYCGSFYGPLKRGVMRAIGLLLSPMMRRRSPLFEVVVFHAVAKADFDVHRGRAYFADPEFQLRDERL